ncbi:hypothetical protein GGS26DRAFT_572344 [Hypomontagnella submonticulosa]|nr:hypothetical protein GGS26DRAFT_572344 [Hypomontagnella submonticulosa]
METTLTTFLETTNLKPGSFVDAYPFIKAMETDAEYEACTTPEIAMTASQDSRIRYRPANRKASARTEHWTKIADCEPTSLEICWFVDFTDNGTKISRVVEFIDMAVATRMIEDMMKKGHRKDGNTA